jgi:DNA-binding LytR/AlgR family response regulator
MKPKTDTVQPLTERILFVSENQHESLELSPRQIDYISSQDNYIEIVWQAEDKLNRKLLRGTLTKAEETVETYPFLFRCHRAYIVNLEKVINIEGNAQGYRLQLRNNPEVIPVSRSKGRQTQELLQRMR